MILPTKHLTADRALLGLGAEVLKLLSEPRTLSSLWYELRESRRDSSIVTYDWFILCLCFLNTIQAVEIRDDKIYRADS